MECSFCRKLYVPSVKYIGQVALQKTSKGDVGWMCQSCKESGITQSNDGKVKLLEDVLEIVEGRYRRAG